MNKFKVCFQLFIILAFILQAAVFAQEKDLDELKDLREDIQIINLLNSLNLRREQMEFILQETYRAEDIRKTMLAVVSANKSEMLKAFGAIKQEVQTGRVTIEKEDAKAFHEIKQRIEYMTKDANAKIDGIAQGIETRLEEFQLIALDGYKPCIIPIMNNGRIGQSDPGTGIVKILERVKASSEQLYAQRKDEFVSRLLERIKSKVPSFVAIDEAKVKSDIMKTFKEIRDMDDVDFQVKKTVTAEELHNKAFPEKFSLSKKEKIKKFLLTKNIIPILEARLNKS